MSKDTFVIVDPAMGDNGELYKIFDNNTKAKKEKNKALALLSQITPNGVYGIRNLLRHGISL